MHLYRFYLPYITQNPSLATFDTSKIVYHDVFESSYKVQ